MAAEGTERLLFERQLRCIDTGIWSHLTFDNSWCFNSICSAMNSKNLNGTEGGEDMCVVSGMCTERACVEYVRMLAILNDSISVTYLPRRPNSS